MVLFFGIILILHLAGVCWALIADYKNLKVSTRVNCFIVATIVTAIAIVLELFIPGIPTILTVLFINMGIASELNDPTSSIIPIKGNKGNSGAPVVPVVEEPVVQVEPVQPATPVVQVEPVQPATPVVQVEPVQVQPVVKATPAQPVVGAQSVEPGIVIDAEEIDENLLQDMIATTLNQEEAPVPTTPPAQVDQKPVAPAIKVKVLKDIITYEDNGATAAYIRNTEYMGYTIGNHHEGCFKGNPMPSIKYKDLRDKLGQMSADPDNYDYAANGFERV